MVLRHFANLPFQQPLEKLHPMRPLSLTLTTVFLPFQKYFKPILLISHNQLYRKKLNYKFYIAMAVKMLLYTEFRVFLLLKAVKS